jgi:hypothetical protein
MYGFAKHGSSAVYDRHSNTDALQAVNEKYCKKTHSERWLNCYVAIPHVHVAHIN